MTSQSASAIAVDGIDKAYGGLEVLKGVSFVVEPGSVFALLGSNGAGKTTLIRILTTLLRADGGAAFVNGHNVLSHPDLVRESCSLTGQFAAVDGVLTGRENLVLVGKLRGIKQPRKTAEELLSRFGLADAADRKVSEYSGGMKRVLDLVMSLVGNPAVVFLDEPTTGLDPERRAEVWKSVKALADAGTTVFLTTQYLDEAEALADRIAILHQGRILIEGTLEELKNLLPAAKVEYVEKRPSLEEVFLALVGPQNPPSPGIDTAR